MPKTVTDQAGSGSVDQQSAQPDTSPTPGLAPGDEGESSPASADQGGAGSKNTNPANPADDTAPKGRPLWLQALIGFAQQFAAAGTAVALPIFDVLGDNPTFFVAREASGSSVIWLTAVLLLFPALIGFAVGTVLWAIGRALDGPRGARIGWALSIAGWAVLIALPVADEATSGSLLLTLALSCGFAFVIGFGVFTHGWMRTALVLLTALPVLFAGWFLFGSGVADVVRPNTAEAATTATTGDTNIVFMTFDEMTLAALLDPDLNIDADRYPNIAELASRSTWYRNATTSQPQTYKAIPSLLTGRYRDGEMPNVSVWPNNLFTLLDDDYEITAFEPLTQLCATACDVRGATGSFGDDSLSSMLDDLGIVYRHLVYPTKWAAGLPRIDTGWGNFAQAAEGEPGADASNASTTATTKTATSAPSGGETTTTQLTTHDGQPVKEWTFDDIQDAIADARSDRDVLFADFLGTLDGDKRGNIWFNHSVLPHEPIEFLPDGRTYPLTGDPGTVYGRNWWYAPQAVPDRQLQAYLLQMEYVDSLIGDFLARMDEEDLWDDSIVVVTADHGVSFWAGQQRRWTSDDNIEDLSRVPLFIHLPGQEPGQISDRNVESVDVFPTILDQLGVDRTSVDYEGTSLLDENAPERSVKLIWPYAKGGKPREFDGSWPGELRLEQHIRDLFETESGQIDPWAIGPYRNLVGTDVSDLNVGSDADATARLIDPTRYVGMDPDAPLPYATAPAGLKGSIALGADIVVAANGTIVGSGNVVVDRKGEPLLSPMVRPDRFEPGDNTIEFYQVTGGAARPVLHRIPQA